MIYNPDTGEILTRTPKSWLQITAFYLVYYSLLAAFWLVCLQIFFLTLPEGKPRYNSSSSYRGQLSSVHVPDIGPFQYQRKDRNRQRIGRQICQILSRMQRKIA